MRSEGGPAALAGVALGHLVELYDFAVFAASASILAKVVTPGQGGLTSVFVVLAAALLVRPLGAVLVGRVADLTGRRIPFLAMTLLMLVSTAAVGLLPSAATAGVGALIGLTLLRLLQAFSVGGETSTSVSYLFELAPADRRGLYGGVHLAAAAVGMALGIGTVLAVQTLLTPAQLLAWGWRLPFLLALPLGLATFALRRRLVESRAFAHTRRRGADHTEADRAVTGARSLVRRHPRTILAGLLLGGAFSVTVNVWFVVLPGILLAAGRQGAGVVLGGAVAGLLACAGSAPLRRPPERPRRPARRADHRVRRAVPRVADPPQGCRDGPVAGPLSSWPASRQEWPCRVSCWRRRLPEAFETRDRATGVGLTFGVGGAVLGGLAPLLATWLHGPGSTTALVLYATACAVLAAAALAWSVARADVSSADNGAIVVPSASAAPAVST